VSAPSVHAAPARGLLGPLPGAERGVRAERLPARGGARRLPVLHLPHHRSKARTPMTEPAGSFLFRVWPYLALTLAVAGLAVRFLVTSDRLPVLTRVLPRAQRQYLGGWSWRACWALLVAAHVAGLAFPQVVVGLTRTPAR